MRRESPDFASLNPGYDRYHAKTDPEVAALRVEDLRESRLVVCDPAPIPLVDANVQRFAHVAAE